MKKKTSNFIIRFTRKANSFCVTGVYFVMAKFVIFLLYLVSLYFTYKLFAGVFKDTTAITNVYFGVVAALSGLSFSCSRAITDSDNDKDMFAFAGERLFHSAILLLTASALKYGSAELGILDIHNIAASKKADWRTILSLIPGSVVGLLFFWAINSAHGGVLIINRLLWKRHHRYADWDNFY